jgi:hypothetical protein
VQGHVDRGSAAGHGSGRGGTGLYGFAAPAHGSPGTTAHKDVKVASRRVDTGDGAWSGLSSVYFGKKNKEKKYTELVGLSK